MTGIFSTANNGLTTPAGLTVGMDADAIEQAYGEPWKNDRGYISYHEEGKWLVFTTHNGKITEIKLFDYVVNLKSNKYLVNRTKNFGLSLAIRRSKEH